MYYYVIYTDGKGGSFSELCAGIDSLVVFIKLLPDKFTITAITKSI